MIEATQTATTIIQTTGLEKFFSLTGLLFWGAMAVIGLGFLLLSTFKGIRIKKQK